MPRPPLHPCCTLRRSRPSFHRPTFAIWLSLVSMRHWSSELPPSCLSARRGCASTLSLPFASPLPPHASARPPLRYDGLIFSKNPMPSPRSRGCHPRLRRPCPCPSAPVACWPWAVVSSMGASSMAAWTSVRGVFVTSHISTVASSPPAEGRAATASARSPPGSHARCTALIERPAAQGGDKAPRDTRRHQWRAGAAAGIMHAHGLGRRLAHVVWRKGLALLLAQPPGLPSLRASAYPDPLAPISCRSCKIRLPPRGCASGAPIRPARAIQARTPTWPTPCAVHHWIRHRGALGVPKENFPRSVVRH